MQTIPLYRYIRTDGGVTLSTVKPETKYTESYRLAADEGYILTDGINSTYCVDTDNPSAWAEVSEMTETEEKSKAYDILMGVSE